MTIERNMFAVLAVFFLAAVWQLFTMPTAEAAERDLFSAVSMSRADLLNDSADGSRDYIVTRSEAGYIVAFLPVGAASAVSPAGVLTVDELAGSLFLSFDLDYIYKGVDDLNTAALGGSVVYSSIPVGDSFGSYEWPEIVQYGDARGGVTDVEFIAIACAFLVAFGVVKLFTLF